METDHVSSRFTANSRRLLLRLLSAALALAAFQVEATIIIPNGTVSIEPVSGGVRYVDPNGRAGEIMQGRTFGDPSPNRTLPVTEKYRLPFNPSQSLNVGRTLTAAEIAAAAVALGAAAYGGCAAGTAIAKAAGLGTSGNGSRTGCNLTDWLIDLGSDPAPAFTGWDFSSAACPNKFDAISRAQCYWSSTTVTGLFIQSDTLRTPPTYRDVVVCGYTSLGGQTCVQVTGKQVTDSGSPRCPASIDALNPAWSVPAGDPGPDGKCATGRYNVATPAQAAARIAQYGDPAGLKPLAEDVLSKGGSIETASPRTLSGPASSPVQTSTKTATAPNGTTSVVTTNTVNNYTYNGDTITNTTVTTINYPDGSQEVEETKEETPDPCVSDPTSAACLDPGTPDSAEIPKQTKTVTFTPVTFSANQVCPGPVQFSVFGRQLEFSYSPMCDTISTWIRALVLAACAFIGAYVFIGGLKA